MSRSKITQPASCPRNALGYRCLPLPGYENKQASKLGGLTRAGSNGGRVKASKRVRERVVLLVGKGANGGRGVQKGG